MTVRLFRVKVVAAMTGVTVRTLHHYDNIGLLHPSQRSESGYRLYSERDLRRLQQILLYRELGLALDEIASILQDPDFDIERALVSQREQLLERRVETDRMIRSVDLALASLRGEREVQLRELFDGFDPADYEEEVQERWGDTDSYRESQRRTKSYTPADWQRCKAEEREILTGLAAKLQADVPATDSAVLDLAERHRRHIDTWFYACSHEMHGGLSEMYVQDPRFTASFDAHASGLARYLAAAIRGNVERASGAG